jgi:glycoprotein 6-alpha-L-fucosyltransferase
MLKNAGLKRLKNKDNWKILSFFVLRIRNTIFLTIFNFCYFFFLKDDNIEHAKVVKMPIIDLLSGGHSKFLPLSVPQAYFDTLTRFHGDPFVWWAGQLLTYIMRYNLKIETLINSTAERFHFPKLNSPCVGVHIRRTDKIGSEAAFHSLDEYMKHVDEFYDLYELMKNETTSSTSGGRNVYLASDDPAIFDEAVSKYPKYTFIYDKQNAQTAQLSQRYTPDSAQGVILDIYFLSQCDYLVCTFSSQVCRMAYELMQARFPDASWRFRSLDDIYYFGGQNAHNVRAVYDHEARRELGEIGLRKGDLIGLAGNHWNGMSKGRNRRTMEEGLFPTYKVAHVFTQF